MDQAKVQVYMNQAIDWAIHFLPNFFGAIIFLMLGWWVIGKLDKTIKVALEKKHFEVSLTSFLRTLFSIGSKTILLIMVAGQIGFQTTSLAAIIGAVGLAVGLALQGSLANLAGGVLILIFKPYKVGDVISTSGVTGKVKEIQIFNTILLLGDNRTVMLPNGSVSNSSITNNHKQPFLKTSITIQIPASLNYRDVMADLKDVFYYDTRILKKPEIDIQLEGFKNNKIYLIATLACHPDQLKSVKTDALENLYKYYVENKIEF